MTVRTARGPGRRIFLKLAFLCSQGCARRVYKPNSHAASSRPHLAPSRFRLLARPSHPLSCRPHCRAVPGLSLTPDAHRGHLCHPGGLETQGLFLLRVKFRQGDPGRRPAASGGTSLAMQGAPTPPSQSSAPAPRASGTSCRRADGDGLWRTLHGALHGQARRHTFLL